MTHRLRQALWEHRHMRGDRVLYRDDGTTVSEETLRDWVRAAQRRANLKASGAKQILRHTFCSHLAMQGATAIASKELAGHSDLQTTVRYMHLSPSHKVEAINLLSRGRMEKAAEGSAAAQTDGSRGATAEPLRKSGLST